MEMGYDNEALIKFFKEGLPESLVNKIMLQTDGVPETLHKWFELAIRREPVKPKITRKVEETMIGKIGLLSESERQDYLAQGKCFRCAKTGHISKDCPSKGQTSILAKLQTEPPKKLSVQEMFTGIKTMVLDQTEEDQKEIFDLMGQEAKLTRHSIRIPVQYNIGTEIVETKALIDSGAGGCFISEEEARHLKKPWTKLDKPIKVYNVDGTRNKTGWITHSITIDLSIGDKSMMETMLISGLGPEHMILGLPWLQDHNPSIDWVTGVIQFRLKQKILVRRPIKLFVGILDRVEDEEVLIRSFIQGEENSNKIRINAKLSVSQVLAQAHEVKAKPLEELLPTYLSNYSDQFEKKKAEQFPPSRPYDHTIDLKLDFKLWDCKIYSLSPKEQIEQDKFLDKNLWKGYIRLSKSPMASPFFFVAKKEAGALRPCQDYWNLNSGTIKNCYPLPLVTDLVDKLKTAKVFLKLDL
ncbi:hypothetical protein Moror_667 [Moniliophthora roreri MCA 2997]|uniref:CCHC-type domain-containing protein n=1 Tax=Moniliophthora roreri (strain MCA 2997) TaxID=1381753 RepID=V2W526_MONRO|nr:hypothetical protein Moror_667 [Moniliophthora roreri MCA 2997]